MKPSSISPDGSSCPENDTGEVAVQIENYPKYRFFLRYQSPEKEEAFRNFWMSRFDKERLSLDVVVMIVIAIISFILKVLFFPLLVYTFKEKDVLLLLSFGFMCLCAICAVILLLLVVSSPESFIRQTVGRHRVIVKVYALYLCNFSLVLSVGIHLVARYYNGPCKNGQPLETCQPNIGGVIAAHHVLLAFACLLSVISCRGLVSFGHFILEIVVVTSCYVSSSAYSHYRHNEDALTIVPTMVSILSCLVPMVILTIISQGIVHQAMTTFEYHMALKQALERQLLLVREQADSDKQHLRMVLANVAHDLKTPLQALHVGIHSLSSTPADCFSSDKVWSNFGSILEDMESSYAFMTMQINRALDVSKSDMKVSLIPKTESFHLRRPVEWAMGIMRSIQGRVSIVAGDISATLMEKVLISDVVWFQENLLCLLSNAVKYSPPDTTVSVYLSHQDKISPVDHSVQEYLVVQVHDQGIGVREEMRQNLFKPFSQTMRRAGGTGLGLYSLALRIDALGGNYGVTARLDGEGSIFHFSIPYKEDFNAPPADKDRLVATMQSIGGSGNRIGETTGLGKKRSDDTTEGRQRSVNSLTSDSERTNTDGSSFMVLIVDDSVTTLKVMSRAIKQSGAIVDQATDGYSALRLMKRNLYTAVLMDIQMPIMVCDDSDRYSLYMPGWCTDCIIFYFVMYCLLCAVSVFLAGWCRVHSAAPTMGGHLLGSA